MHTEKVFAIRAGGPAGEVLSAAWSREVLLWDTVTGEAAKLLDIEFCTHLEVSCDWRTIFVAGGDRVWCYNRDGQETWDYDFSQEEVTAMSLDGGGALLAVATGIGGGIEGGYRLRRIHIVDVETKARVITFEGHDADIVSLCFSHDRSRLASGASDGSLAVWLVVDPFDGARWATAPEDDPNLGLQIAYEKPFDSPVKELGFLASKNELIVQLEDVWHLNIKSMEKKMLVQGGFSPQTRTSLEGLLGVVSAVHQDLETEVRASDGQVVGFLPARLSHVACDPDRLLICGSEGPVVHIYEAVFDDTDAS